jgi:Fe-S cluster biogenesis protein NfuA
MTVDKIKNFIDTTIAPALAEHNGYLSFEGYDADTKTVKVKYLGMCANCPSSYLSTHQTIYSLLTSEFPEHVEDIERIN